jgi:hypothetical protein
VNIVFAVFIEPVLRIWDPVPFFDPWILDPGSRMGKKSGSIFGVNNPDLISRSLKNNFLG